MTIITFKRSGGFIGPGMRYQIDLEHLPDNNAQLITQLIEQAEFFSLPENMIIKFNPNEYQYTITIDSGTLCRTVRTNDTTMPDLLRPLVEELSVLKSIAG